MLFELQTLIRVVVVVPSKMVTAADVVGSGGSDDNLSRESVF